MTREEAIQYLNTLYMALAVFPNQQISLGNVDEMKESVSMAIKALEQEPCDDAISRQAVLEMAYDMSEIDGEHFSEPCMVVDVEDIQRLPSVTQKSETVTEFADRCRECGAKYGKLLKQEPCDDAISREETLTAFADYVGGGMSMDDYDALWNIVAKMPSVNPQEPKTGKWEDLHRCWICSECGQETHIEHNYCPNCGAKMV